MKGSIRHLAILGIILSTLIIELEGFASWRDPWARSYYDDEMEGRKGSDEFTDNGSEEELPPPPPRPSPGRPRPGPGPDPPPPRPGPGPDPPPPIPPPPEPGSGETPEPPPPRPPYPDPGSPELPGPMPPPIGPGPTGPEPGSGITGQLNFYWNTTVGWNTTISGSIEGGREHEQRIILDNGGYIYDKDWLKWKLAFETNPYVVSTFGINGGVRFGNIGGGIGGRRKRRALRRKGWK